MKRPANQIRPRSCRKQKPSGLQLLELPEDLHRAAALYALEEGITLDALIRDVISEWLERYRRTTPPDGAS